MREQHVVSGSSGYHDLGLPLLALLPFCPIAQYPVFKG
jgi:hypothetical protein